MATDRRCRRQFLVAVRGKIEVMEMHDGYLFVLTARGIYRLDPLDWEEEGGPHGQK